MLADLVVDAPRRDAEQTCGLRLIAVRGLQRHLHQRSFARGERSREIPAVQREHAREIGCRVGLDVLRRGARAARHTLPDFRGQIDERQRLVVFFVNDGAPHQVFDLAGITGELVFGERGDELFAD